MREAGRSRIRSASCSVNFRLKIWREKKYCLSLQREVKKGIVMEEKEYMKGTMASESATAAAYIASSIAEPTHGVIDGLPKTVGEALSAIEEGEREFERGESFTHKDVMQMIWQRIDSYAG